VRLEIKGIYNTVGVYCTNVEVWVWCWDAVHSRCWDESEKIRKQMINKQQGLALHNHTRDVTTPAEEYLGIRLRGLN